MWWQACRYKHTRTILRANGIFWVIKLDTYLGHLFPWSLCLPEFSQIFSSYILAAIKLLGPFIVCIQSAVLTNLLGLVLQPHFWVWRVGGPYVGPTQAPRAGIRGVGIYSRQIVIRPVLLMVLKRHPSIVILWVLLLAFMTYLFIDAINASTIGYAAMPIGFIFGKVVS